MQYKLNDINPFMPSGLFYLLTGQFPVKGVSGLFSLLPCFIEMSVINATSVDPRSAASDLGLHYLPMSHLWYARHKWVNTDDTVVYDGWFELV